jgi:hypothetical protein
MSSQSLATGNLRTLPVSLSFEGVVSVAHLGHLKERAMKKAPAEFKLPPKRLMAIRR